MLTLTKIYAVKTGQPRKITLLIGCKIKKTYPQQAVKYAIS